MGGKLIVIDGLDGSGKATQTKFLVQYLQSKLQEKVKTITFPDYESNSSALVKMYLGGEFGSDPNSVNPYAASSFYAVDRYASFKTKWEKDFLNGSVFVADRYTTSNAIHQMAKLPQGEKETFLNWLSDFEYKKLGLPQPACVLYLDMNPEVSQKLMSSRYQQDESKKDIHEANLKYLKTCRESALVCASLQNWQVVKCDDGENPLSVEEIHQKVCKIIDPLF